MYSDVYLLPAVGIEPTTLGLLDPRSNQLSYAGFLIYRSENVTSFFSIQHFDIAPTIKRNDESDKISSKVRTSVL